MYVWYMKAGLFLCIMFFLGCQETKDWLMSWQQKQVEKRYGKVNKREKLPDWQKEVIQYESVIDEKIQAGINAAKVYRKLGEAYAEFEMFRLCEINIKKAIGLGLHQPEVLFQLGLCQGNQASSLNWPKDKTRESAETFIKVLNKNPKFDKAKYELALIYFYGFTRQNRYSILSDVVTISQRKLRKKAILIMKEYQLLKPEDKRSYFALAGFYIITNFRADAMKQMQSVMVLLQKLHPKSYNQNPSFIQAKANYNQVMKKKR